MTLPATTDTESLPATVASLPGVPDGMLRPAAPLVQIEQAFRDYSVLCDRLLDDNDYQRIGSKDFRKKSAWRKLATAFNVSCTLVSRDYERDDHQRIIRAEVVVRATAPNGRCMDGLGACDLYERCCERDCSKKGNHRHCAAASGEFCPGSTHFSNSQHDLPATAFTRAENRACSDLFGMGEVSAEEIVNEPGEHRSPGPDVWFAANGWGSKAEHDAWHASRRAKAKAMGDANPATREALMTWCADNGLSFSAAVPRGLAEAFDGYLTGLISPAPGQPVPTAPASTPQSPKAPQNPRHHATSTVAPFPAPRDEVQAVIERFDRMPEEQREAVFAIIGSELSDCNWDDGKLLPDELEAIVSAMDGVEPFEPAPTGGTLL